MAKNIEDITFNMTTAVDIGVVAAPEDTVLAGLLEELEGNDPTIGDTTGEIIEPEVVSAADDLIDDISAQAADTVASMNAEAADADPLDSLLEEVSVPPAAADDPVAKVADADPLDDLLEDVASAAARIEAKQQLYAEQEAPEAAGEGDAPQTDAAAVTDQEKPKKARAKKEKEPKAPKEPRPTSVTHKPGDLLIAKLGAKANDYLIFDLDSVANEIKRDAFVERMNDREAIADKVKDKITMLVTWLASGKDADGLNEVLRRTFTVLAKDGALTSGDKGNLQLDLLAKPYSMGTARSQASQMFMALPELGMVIKTKGQMVPNPNSIMLQAVNAQLGLV